MDCKDELDTALPLFATRCGQCYSTRREMWENAPKRQCSSCLKNSILATDPQWKTICGTCYAQQPTCERCPRKLKPGSPAYLKKCHICWLDDRKKTHEVCPTCTGTQATHLRKKIGEDYCASCRSQQELTVTVTPSE